MKIEALLSELYCINILISFLVSVATVPPEKVIYSLFASFYLPSAVTFSHSICMAIYSLIYSNMSSMHFLCLRSIAVNKCLLQICYMTDTILGVRKTLRPNSLFSWNVEENYATNRNWGPKKEFRVICWPVGKLVTIIYFENAYIWSKVPLNSPKL